MTTTTRSGRSANANGNDAQEQVQAQAVDSRHAVDIRVFVALLTVVMAIAFGLGVGLGPLPPQSAPSTSVSTPDSTSASASALPKVTSVDVQDVEPDPRHPGDLHEPAGQHLLVDIKGIESDFLDSEERLAQAMVDTITESELTLLSYHCHKLVPKGVSCVGVLLESHISFHTWPDEGVITLDLFTCGAKPLLPTVHTIQRLFGIPRENEEIQMQWSHELRGFKTKHDTTITQNSDLSRMIWSPIDMAVKQLIYSGVTNYQRIDIWDTVGLEETPTHQDVLKHDLQKGDPRWNTAEIVTPTRYLFLDGTLQSESSAQEEYHEAMVHPPMFTHPNPKHVAIVGGAEGATLREVLKHKHVESVSMIEIDEQLIQLVQEHMPYMADCSDLVGRADNCLQDDLANIIIDDAKEWFLRQSRQEQQQQFDVIIVDAIEPETDAPISKHLYDTEESLHAMLSSLTDEGVLAIQIGRAPTFLDPRPDIGFNAPREKLFQTLEKMDEVEAMFVYEDGHCGFQEPRAFMIVCRSNSCRERFYATGDAMDYQIYDRIVRTHSKERALKYFDGVTHLGYQVAPKAWETLYCRREPTPFECAYRHLDFAAEIFEYELEEEEGSFGVTADFDDAGDVVQTFVHALDDIPAGSYIMPSHLAASLTLSHRAIENLRGNLQYGDAAVISDFVDFVDAFGHESQASGSARRLVEVGASYFIRSTEDVAEANVGRWIPPHPNGKRPKYSPVYERHRLSFDVFMVATKDIPEGTELLRYAGMWDQP